MIFIKQNYDELTMKIFCIIEQYMIQVTWYWYTTVRNELLN
jgi:hypothetical protein